MNFRPLKSEDRKPIYDMYQFNNTLGTEYCFVMLFYWMQRYNAEICIEDEAIYLRITVDGEKWYYPPLVKTKDKMDNAIAALEESGAVIFTEITEFTKHYFCARGYKFIELRNNAEYVYLSEKLRALAGKKLHSKRNFVMRFSLKYSYDFLSYKKEDLIEIKALFEKWEKEKAEAIEDISEFEKEAIEEKEIIFSVLSNLEENHCFADILRVDGHIIGFSIGEILPTGVGAVYFEKADVSYEGAYPILNKLFAEKHFSKVKYVNRQEDMGDEGLRKAKLSYHPAKIYMKFLAEKIEIKKNFDEDLIILYREAFPEDKEETVQFFFNKVFSPEGVKEIRENNELISALHVLKKKLKYFHSEIDLPFIVGVATFKEYRGKNYAKQLMKETLDCMRLNEMPFVALYPQIEGFYETLGFEKVFSLQEQTENFTKAEGRNVSLINSIYNEVAQKFDVYLTRDEQSTALRMEEEKGANILTKNGELIGYELYDEDISEVCLKRDFKFSEPIGMARILNIEKAFQLLKLKKTYRFSLTDCIFSENNGIFEVSKEEINLTEEPEFSLTERELVGLFFGREVKGVPLDFLSEFPKNAFLIDKY